VVARVGCGSAEQEQRDRGSGDPRDGSAPQGDEREHDPAEERHAREDRRRVRLSEPGRRLCVDGVRHRVEREARPRSHRKVEQPGRRTSAEGKPHVGQPPRRSSLGVREEGDRGEGDEVDRVPLERAVRLPRSDQADQKRRAGTVFH